jgi:hypothetical protein
MAGVKPDAVTKMTQAHFDARTNLLGAPASSRPVGSLKLELADETPALPGIVPRFIMPL